MRTSHERSISRLPLIHRAHIVPCTQVNRSEKRGNYSHTHGHGHSKSPHYIKATGMTKLSCPLLALMPFYLDGTNDSYVPSS